MTKLPFEAIIFDLDGTLIDTESADLWACQRLYQEHGATLPPEFWVEHIVGHLDNYDLLFAELMQRNGHGLTTESLRRRLKELWAISLDQVQPMPGVVNLLSALRAAGYPVAIATASERTWSNRWLTAFDLLPHFQVIATCDDVVHSKPAPDVYLYAAAQLGVKPEHCLVFEDSLPGLTAAKSAGMTVVAVLNHVTQNPNFSQADGVITSLEQITVEWLETFNLQLSTLNSQR
jgi:HAD superfamily hydrolase (TIGR01509 family)